MNINLEHTYADSLKEFVVESKPDKIKQPKLVYFNQTLSSALQFDINANEEDELTQWLSGQKLLTKTYAQAYAGHQFGHYNPQLGDGRALILGEYVDPLEQRHDIALKGSGKTAFSRGGDGKAALGPMLREVLISEAMHALGIPTTRSLAVVATGEDVYRQLLKPGAILCRTASSHIRIGTFQFVSNYRGKQGVQRLADYTINRHFPSLSNLTNPYLAMLKETVRDQAYLVAAWSSVGFIHGVMNTDNVCLSGETIDYGPCAFMESYDPTVVFSSIDQDGRYAYQNQPAIAQWNLARLAETLLPLISEDEQEAIELATDVVTRFGEEYKQAWHQAMRRKLGFYKPVTDSEQEQEIQLLNEFLSLLHKQKADFTLSWRYLMHLLSDDDFHYGEIIQPSEEFTQWLLRYKSMQQIQATGDKNNVIIKPILDTMGKANPLIIPRNHLVEQALDSASDRDDFTDFYNLLDKVTSPFEPKSSEDRYVLPASDNFTRSFRTFCGT